MSFETDKQTLDDLQMKHLLNVAEEVLLQVFFCQASS